MMTKKLEKIFALMALITLLFAGSIFYQFNKLEKDQRRYFTAQLHNEWIHNIVTSYLATRIEALHLASPGMAMDKKEIASNTIEREFKDIVLIKKLYLSELTDKEEEILFNLMIEEFVGVKTRLLEVHDLFLKNPNDPKIQKLVLQDIPPTINAFTVSVKNLLKHNNVLMAQLLEEIKYLGFSVKLLFFLSIVFIISSMLMIKYLVLPRD